MIEEPGRLQCMGWQRIGHNQQLIHTIIRELILKQFCYGLKGYPSLNISLFFMYYPREYGSSTGSTSLRAIMSQVQLSRYYCEPEIPEFSLQNFHLSCLKSGLFPSFDIPRKICCNKIKELLHGKPQQTTQVSFKVYFSMTSLVAQMVKNLPAMWETWVQSLGQEDPLEKGMATHSRTSAWRVPWTEGL